MKSLDNPYLHVLFCDDVRLEVGNKLTLVGLYSGQLNVAEAPVILPKLCVYALFVTPVQQEVTELTFRVYRDDELVAENKQTDFPSIPSHLVDDSTVTRREYTAAFTFAPFPIEGPSVLTVEVETATGTYGGPRLRIAVTEMHEESRPVRE
ncbi:DUF6941 family protein [Paraburkholderia heleia]|uniref:DUF6941 family protein n=1 Tax=Paraburkholderia heleia TaxID=634127 RepID=UPI002AB711BB|nr:hypothetical protein [Paraburkholderia heleia]